jgi:hypothetical protein
MSVNRRSVLAALWITCVAGIVGQRGREIVNKVPEFGNGLMPRSLTRSPPR